MKKLFAIALLGIAICFSACAQKRTNNNNAQNDKTMSKTLVAYFSASGVTAQAAKTLAHVAQADLFEIVPEQPYTDADLDWTNKQSRSTLEMNDKASRPAIASRVQNMEQYDTLFVGYPIWWYVAPTIINTFLEQYNLEGKVVVPFFTSGGSGAGETMLYLRPSAPKAQWKEPQSLNHMSEDQMAQWVKSI